MYSGDPIRRTRVAPPLQILQGKTLSGIPWLVHGFSTRAGGVSSCYGSDALNLGQTVDDTPANVERNRALFLNTRGARDAHGKLWPLGQVKQIHSAIVHRANAEALQPVAGDGMLTNYP